MEFEWDPSKDRLNFEKHGLLFDRATLAFLDPRRVIVEDLKHSQTEDRYLCIGRVENRIATVRFTVRDNRIRIFGAGYWRRGRRIYGQSGSLH